MPPLQREQCAQGLKPKTCCEQSQPCATDLTGKSPSMRAEWSNCWWMACVTDEDANRHALKPDMDDHQSFKSIYGQLIVVLGTETLYRTAVSSI